MGPYPVTLTPIVERCAWCGAGIDADMRVTIAGGRFRGWAAEHDHLRGHVVRVRTRYAARTVMAMMPLPNTPAHYAGYDLLFVLCSLECRDALDAAIGNEPMVLLSAGRA